MFAIIQTGGKQYRVQKGDTLRVEKLVSEEGKGVIFDTVLLIDTGDTSRVGTPYVTGAKVLAEVVRNGRARKIKILKFKPKSRYRLRKGHRQPYTEITITDIKE